MAAVTVLENLPPGPELAMAYGTLARLRGTTLNDDEAIAWGERAIALAERLGATTTLVDALITVGAANLARGRVELGHEQLERSISLSTAAGLDELSVRAHANLGFGYDEQYRFDLAAHHFARGIEFATERDLDNARQHMTAWLAHCHLFLGDWTQAADLAGSVLAAPDVAPVTHFVALLVDAMVRIRRGEPGAEPLLDAALALAEASGSLYHLGPVRAARAEAAYFRGDRSSVVAEASAALDLALERRQQWYAGELAYWRWKGGGLQSPPDGIAEPFARQIAGDWERAAAHWDELGCPFEAARARAEGTDQTALHIALATFEQLGAHPAAAAVRRRFRELGARGIPRGPRPSTRTNPAKLTQREVEVVALLTRGQSNQEIADHLFLSSRTVETHVAAILAKLGVATRADATVAAKRLELIPQSE
jgi:ATP/maltotriose-dependent transcriptional regulator MalT